MTARSDKTAMSSPSDLLDAFDLDGRRLSRREVLALLGAGGAAAALGVLPASVSAQGVPNAKRGGILKVSGWANPSSLDPYTGGSGGDHTFLWTMYDTLVEWDYATLKPIPGLAEWSWPDPKTLLLNIKPGILFHDGTPCDAAAVKANLDRGRSDQRSNIKADLASVASVDVTGPLQVKVNLSRPDTALPAILSDRAGMMSSPKAAAVGKDFDRNPVGTGPWKFVSWADNQKLSVRRFDKYWRTDRGFLDGIDFSIITELSTGLRSVSAGQNDMVYAIPPRLKPVVDRNKDLVLMQGPTLYCLQLYFNLAKKPLDNLKVRQAINYALDRDAFVKQALSGIGEAATMQVPASHWAYDKSVSTLYPHDPARARALLAEAGFKDGFEMTVGGYTDQDSVRRGEIIMEQLRQVGIRLKFTNGTVPEISGQFFGAEKKFDALMSAWTGRPDPAMSYGLMYGKEAYFNAGRLEISPELQKLLPEARASDNQDQRKQVLGRIQRLVMENAAVAPLAFQLELTVLSRKVQGYKPNLLGKPKYEFLSLT
jgi:peptide/nickel transport system permease protein/peptide/nickel transport system substrate-binding protein